MNYRKLCQFSNSMNKSQTFGDKPVDFGKYHQNIGKSSSFTRNDIRAQYNSQEFMRKYNYLTEKKNPDKEILEPQIIYQKKPKKNTMSPGDAHFMMA